MTLFESWPHNWFGLWRNPNDDLNHLPLFESLVDTEWTPPDLKDIADYLSRCPVVISSQAMASPCPLCGVVLDNLTAQQSDGEWVWPSFLEHYITEHHVRLPDRMVHHIRSHMNLIS